MRFARNDETGDLIYQLRPGLPWQPASEELLRQAGMGGGEAIMEDLGRGFRQIGAGVKSIATGEEVDPAFQEEVQAAQLARPQQAGLAQYAPDAALTVGTLGAGAIPGVAARVGAGGVLGLAGAEGALLGAGNVEDPALGAALGGGLGVAAGGLGLGVARGAPAVVRGFRRGMDEMGEVMESIRPARSAGAAANPSPSYEGTVRVQSGLLTPEELEALAKDLGAGKPLTMGDRLALNARVGTGEMARAESRRSMEELARSSTVNDIAFGGVSNVRGTQEGLGTQLVLRELGAGGMAERLGDDVIIAARKELGETFEDAAESAGDLNFTAADTTALNDAALEAIADDRPLVQGFVDRIAADLAKHNSKLPYAVAQEYRSRLASKATAAAQNGQYQRASSLGDIEDVLDAIVDRQITPSVREALADARYRYRIYKALERSTSTVGSDAQLNLRSFVNAYQRRGNRFMRSSRHTGGLEGEVEMKGDEVISAPDSAQTRGEGLARALRTLDYLTTRTTPSSGTAERLMANAPLRAVQALGMGVGASFLGG